MRAGEISLGRCVRGREFSLLFSFSVFFFNDSDANKMFAVNPFKMK